MRAAAVNAARGPGPPRAVGLIVPDADADAHAEDLAAAGLEHEILGPESDGTARLLVIPRRSPRAWSTTT